MGLAALINGKSKRSAAELSGVPPTTLYRMYHQLTGKRPNVKRPLTQPQRNSAMADLLTFKPKRMGAHRRLFLEHEELLMVGMLEVAAEAAFPYNADALEATALHLGRATYGAQFTLGKRGKWRRSFEK